MDTMQLAGNVERIRDRMAQAAIRAGRQPEDILLCAACKAQPSELVKVSAGLAIDVFGENRAQELSAHLNGGAFAGKPCHFIGSLQTNKVRQVVGKVGLIQSVDRARLLLAINTEAARQGLVQDILFEINLAGEESKAGAKPEDLKSLLEIAAPLHGVRVRGLMAIPPVTADGEKARPYFSALRELMVQARLWGLTGSHFDTLSMGMSGTYEAAILEGATLVRVGREIYGERR